MIVFDLKCDNGHLFEGWFEDNISFDTQKNKGFVSCPYCNSENINKVISTFGIKRLTVTKKNTENVMSKLKNYINKNFDNVGTDFTNEALKMHYGITKNRNIIGSSSPEEEKVMNTEGIKFLKLPLPTKKDRNSDS